MSCGGSMTSKSVDHNLVRRVLSNVLTSHPVPSCGLDTTEKSIAEAVSSLAPFEPPEGDLIAINSVLRRRQASDIACKAAWALYKDYALNADKNQ